MPAPRGRFQGDTLTEPQKGLSEALTVKVDTSTT